MERRHSAALLGIIIILIASGCDAAPRSVVQTPTPSHSTPTRTVVAIGDSIPFNSQDDCPGCTGFVESFAGALGDASGETYTAVNVSRHDGARSADILEEVLSGSLDLVLSSADEVIVSIGFNNQPPYDEGSCADKEIDLDTVEGAAEALINTTDECIATQTAKSGTNLAGVLDRVRELAPHAAILVIDAYNAWTGWPEFEALGAETVGPASQTVAAGLDAWQTVVCDEAEAVGGKCIGLLTAFNGSDGLTPAGDLLAADYTHPSQKGNDLIRDLLLAG